MPYDCEHLRYLRTCRSMAAPDEMTLADVDCARME